MANVKGVARCAIETRLTEMGRCKASCLVFGTLWGPAEGKTCMARHEAAALAMVQQLGWQDEPGTWHGAELDDRGERMVWVYVSP